MLPMHSRSGRPRDVDAGQGRARWPWPAYQAEAFGNARLVRNLFESALKHQAVRLEESEFADRNIAREDIAAATGGTRARSLDEVLGSLLKLMEDHRDVATMWS